MLRKKPYGDGLKACQLGGGEVSLMMGSGTILCAAQENIRGVPLCLLRFEMGGWLLLMVVCPHMVAPHPHVPFACLFRLFQALHYFVHIVICI